MLVVIGVIVVLFAALWFFRDRIRFRSFPKGYALIHDGSTFRLTRARVTHLGIEVTKDEVYPLGVSTTMQLPSVHVPAELGPRAVPLKLPRSRRYLFVIAVEPLALVEHQTMERGRRTMVLGSMFKPGGDILRYLQFAAALVPLLASIWLTMQFASVQATLNQQASDLKVVKAVLSAPLVSVPAGAPVPTGVPIFPTPTPAGFGK